MDLPALSSELARQAAALAPRVLWATAAALGFWIASSFSRRLVRSKAARLDPERAAMLNLAAQALSAALKGVGVVVGLGTLGVNVSALVAGLGLTGLALGFALRDALSSVLAGCLILFYRPFRPGDRVSVTGFEGIVSDIDLRYTTLDGGDRKYLIPNSLLLSQAITIGPR